MPRLDVVVVDDEPDICTLLRIQLSTQPDLRVVGTATDGSQGIELCKELRPGAVVMDLLMPGVSGFEAITTLQDELPGIGIVAYTAVAGEYVRSEMARLGVPLVLKSGDITPLAEAVRKAASASP